jgi:hypothetical protein
MPMCGTCNGALNSRFEIPAQAILGPLFRGENATLTPSQQSLASGWIIKGELLMFFWHAHEHPEHPNAEMLRQIVVDMMARGLPPHQTTIRLGRVDPRETPRPADTTMGLLPAAVPQCWMHSVSTIGPLFWEAVVAAEGELDAFIAATDDSDHLIRLWPPREMIALLAAPDPTRTSLGFRSSPGRCALSRHPAGTDPQVLIIAPWPTT